MKFVVIGGDAAGMSAASRAKRRMPDMEAVVLEQSMDVSYSACGMPYNIADPERAIDDLVVRHAQVFRDKQGIDLRTGHRAEKIDPAARTVSGTTSEGAPFQVAYDKLLIATGGRAIVPDLPGFDQPGIQVLKNLDDGRKIKEYIKEKGARKVVVLGMGYIALEMCEALRERDIDVDMIKPREAFIPWMDPDMSDVVRKELEAHWSWACIPATRFCGPNARATHGRSRQRARRLSGDMVLVATGIFPNSEIASDAGLELSVGNSICTDRTARTSDENIYAAGDCADAYHVDHGKEGLGPPGA